MMVGSFVKDVNLKVPLAVLAPQPAPTPEAPFYTEPPPFWSPSEVAAPQGIAVPSAPPLPPELLQPGGWRGWARAAAAQPGCRGDASGSEQPTRTQSPSPLCLCLCRSSCRFGFLGAVTHQQQAGGPRSTRASGASASGAARGGS